MTTGYKKTNLQNCFSFSYSYIHLVPESSLTSSSVCTLLLCSPDETSLEELKAVCQASVSVLHETLGCPYVVPGAGCLDTHLASFLRQYGKTNGLKIAADLGCTRGKCLLGHWYIVLESMCSDWLKIVFVQLDGASNENLHFYNQS